MRKYTFQGIVYSIVVAKSALADLDLVRRQDADAANMILALLTEAKGNQAVLETFTVRDFGASATAPYHVDKWIEQQRAGRNIWRIKIWELEHHAVKFRIVYAFDPRISRYYVLGIFERDFNYAESDPRTKRIIATYESIGIVG